LHPSCYVLVPVEESVNEANSFSFHVALESVFVALFAYFNIPNVKAHIIVPEEFVEEIRMLEHGLH
jgi:hypothetical protein